MVKDDHDQAGRQAPITGTDGRDDSPRGGVGLATAVVLLAAVAGLTAAGTFAARWLFRDPGAAQAGTSKGPEGKPPLFAGWEKPDLVLLLSGQQHGYVQPCGCTRPQRGGLLRRYNLLQNLRQRGWTVVPLDSGDVGQTSGPRDLPNVQGLLKYRYSMEALRLMDYLAVGVGQTDG